MIVAVGQGGEIGKPPPPRGGFVAAGLGRIGLLVVWRGIDEMANSWTYKTGDVLCFVTAAKWSVYAARPT
jgi:hypothetical protein